MPVKLPLVNLRPKRLDDAAMDFEWQTDPEFARLHAKEPLELTFAEFKEEYTHVLKNVWPGRLHFAIETEEGVSIGDCACHNINHGGAVAEIGINLARRDYWGKGYGTAAMKHFVEYVFSCTGLKKLTLRTLEDNLRAQKCFVKAGFKSTGVFEEDGHRFLGMEINREDWMKRDQT